MTSEKHHIFEMHDKDKVGKLQIRNSMNQLVTDVLPGLTIEQIQELLQSLNPAPGVYSIVPFKVNGGQITGSYEIVIEGEPPPPQVVDPTVAVAATAASTGMLERHFWNEQKRIEFLRKELEERQKQLDLQSSTAASRLLDQQAKILDDANTRATKIIEDGRKQAEFIIEQAQARAGYIEQQAEERGVRSTHDAREDAEVFRRRAKELQDEAERRVLAAGALERQLADRKVQLEREAVEYRIKLSEEMHRREMEAFRAEVKAQGDRTAALPKDVLSRYYDRVLDKQFPPDKKGIKAQLQEVLEVVQPLVEALLQQRAPGAALALGAEPPPAADGAGEGAAFPPLPAVPPGPPAPPPVDVDLSALVDGGHPVIKPRPEPEPTPTVI